MLFLLRFEIVFPISRNVSFLIKSLFVSQHYQFIFQQKLTIPLISTYVFFWLKYAHTCRALRCAPLFYQRSWKGLRLVAFICINILVSLENRTTGVADNV